MRSSNFRLRRLFLILVLSIINYVYANAQSNEIKGIVVSTNDQIPLPGVTITVVGTTNGTITDMDGQFSITLPKQQASLSFSMIGFKTVIIDAVKTKGKGLTVEMSEDVVMLDEVVAIGYGHAKRSDVTGSVSSVHAKDIEGRIATSVDDLLRGRVAGVRIISQDGAPGAGVSIKVRGGTSINASSEPLYVIDGFPIMSKASDMTLGSMSGIGSNTNPLSELNPEDIQSIDILKDASATAIYGSRGANGVVIITTKQAETGKSKVSYSGSYSVSLRPKIISMLSNEEFQQFKNEKSNRYKPSPTGNDIYKEDLWNKYIAGRDSLNNVDWASRNNTNWQKEIYRMGHSTKHQLSVTGGNKATNFIFSGDYMGINGIVKNTDYQRFGARLNVKHSINKWITFSTNNTFSWVNHNGITQANGPASQAGAGIFIRAARYNPNIGIDELIFTDSEDSDEDGTISSSNPYVLLRDAIIKKLSRSLISNNFLNFNITKDLTFKTSLGIKVNALKLQEWYGKTTGPGNQVGGKAKIGSIDMIEMVNENILTYSKVFVRKHTLNAMAGLTSQTNHKETYEANARNFPYDGLGLNMISIGTDFVQPGSYVSEWSLLSMLARINYDYDNKYLLTASIRADGSSRFAQNNKWGYFPSFATAWRVSQEDFLNSNNTISNLKLRASYGQTGNQEIGLYRSKSLYGMNNASFNDMINPGFYLSSIANKNLTWETTDQVDFGIDLGLLQNRLSINIDYYYKLTKDLLLNVPTAPSSGFSSTMMNLGKVRNRGFEATIFWEILSASSNSKKIGWTLDLNIAKNENTVMSLGSTNNFYRTLNYMNSAKDQIIIQVGQPLGSWYGYQTDGIFQYNDPDLKKFTSVQGNTPAAGDWKYIDQNGDNKIDENDRVILANATPKFYGGFSTGLSYKNFDLRLMFEYSYGSKIFNATRLILEDMSSSNENRISSVKNRWVGPDWQTMPDGSITAIQGTGNPSNTMPRAGYASTYQLQDTYIEDGSYLRLSDVKFSYMFPKQISKKLGIRNLSAYFSASNLWLWTKYTGSDPEVNIDPNGYGNMISGYDYDAYPRSKTFTVGLNISL